MGKVQKKKLKEIKKFMKKIKKKIMKKKTSRKKKKLGSSILPLYLFTSTHITFSLYFLAASTRAR